MNKKYFIVTLINLLIAGSLGVLLRYMNISPSGINYRFIVHAHSHVAFLGWAYMAFFLLILYLFLPNKFSGDRQYKTMFWLNQISVAGMLIAFPIQGYGLYSIIFSTLHIFLSYWFAYKLNKDLKNKGGNKSAVSFIRASILFLVISSAGPFGLGFIMSQGLSESSIYDLAIYFYLHFQYNGWFIFALLGIFFFLLNRFSINYPEKQANLFFKTYFLACFPAYLLSALWLNTPFYINAIAFVSALVQLGGTIFMFLMILNVRKELSQRWNQNEQLLMHLAICSFLIKNTLQFISSFLIIFQIRHFIIGYLHLTLIGCISLFLLAIGSKLEFISLKGFVSKAAVWLIVCGFVLSELMLFAQGTSYWIKTGTLPLYNELILISSILMPLGFSLLVGKGIESLFSKSSDNISLSLEKHLPLSKM